MAYIEKLKVGLFSLEKRALRANLIALYLMGDHREDKAKLPLERHSERMQSNRHKSQEGQFYEEKKHLPVSKVEPWSRLSGEVVSVLGDI